MTESNRIKIGVDELLQTIRQQVGTRQEPPVLQSKLNPPPFPEEPDTDEQHIHNHWRPTDKLLWKYGMKHAGLINRIPLLKRIAAKQYLRLVSQAPPSSEASAKINSTEKDFLEVNWYYHDFFEQTKQEGLKGRIKRFILKYFGFFTWWQAQINRRVYQELTQLNDRVENSAKKMESLNRELMSKMGEITLKTAKKADQAEVEKVRTEIKERTAMKADQAEVEKVRHEINDFLKQIRNLKLNVLDQQRRLSLLLEEARKRFPETIAREQIANMLEEEDRFLDAMYVTLEDRFRGTREDIKERLEVYLPIVSSLKGGAEKAPILDVGCGRGEWLELLKEHGFIAKGLDVNRIMVQQCQEAGLDAVESDVIEYLRRQNSNTFGAITGFHLVEHLPLKTLIALFDESLRTLKTGGLVIFETPNPENLIVGACNFFLDPTHLHPIPPNTLEFLIEARGFFDVQVLRLRPLPFHLDNEMLQNLLFGATDYAVIGFKK